MRQVPPPSAAAWLIDLSAVRGPRFVVLRGDAAEARAALVDHLADIGTVATFEEAQQLMADADTEPVGVVW